MRCFDGERDKTANYDIESMCYKNLEPGERLFFNEYGCGEKNIPCSISWEGVCHGENKSDRNNDYGRDNEYAWDIGRAGADFGRL